MTPRSWLISLLIAPLAAFAAPAASYRLVDLGYLKRASPSEARAINASGQVVGNARRGQFKPERFAVRFEHGRAIDLAFEAGLRVDQGDSSAVNRRGVIAGWVWPHHAAEYQPFLDDHGQMTLLTMPTGRSGLASALSDRGDLVAIGLDSAGRCVCSYYWSAGHWSALEPLAGSTYTVGTAINRHGLVVGWSDPDETSGLPRRAVLWRHGQIHLVPGTTDQGDAQAAAVNDLGDIAGAIDVAGHTHAFVWRGGVFSDLETDTDAISSAYGLNTRGQVVGFRVIPGGRSGGFIAQDGQLLWLDDLIAPPNKAGWQIGAAVSINESGEIAANGYRADGRVHALRLEPLARR